MAIASQIPDKIKAVVSISGPRVLIGCTLRCRDFTIQDYPVEYTDETYVSYSHYLSIFKSKDACKPGAPSLIPVEHITGKVLLVYGLADELNTEIQCAKKHFNAWKSTERVRYANDCLFLGRDTSLRHVIFHHAQGIMRKDGTIFGP